MRKSKNPWVIGLLALAKLVKALPTKDQQAIEDAFTPKVNKKHNSLTEIFKND